MKKVSPIIQCSMGSRISSGLGCLFEGNLHRSQPKFETEQRKMDREEPKLLLTRRPQTNLQSLNSPNRLLSNPELFYNMYRFNDTIIIGRSSGRSSGYGSWLMFWRSWVRSTVQYAGWTFFTFICCKNVMAVLKTGNKRKRGRGRPISNHWSRNTFLEGDFVAIKSFLQKNSHIFLIVRIFLFVSFCLSCHVFLFLPSHNKKKKKEKHQCLCLAVTINADT